MPEKYTGRADDRLYAGNAVGITYSLRRCIHAKECVNHLAEVFDVKKRPWINPDGASVERVATVLQTCPSGALHYIPKDDSLAEPVPDVNRIIVQKDGYLQFIGNLSIQASGVEIEQETRATLCRCGASAKKPFCDNSHKNIDFEADEPTLVQKDEVAKNIETSQLVITATANASLKIEGPFQIEDEDGIIIFSGTKTWLCRCGGSQKKPFCDSTHKEIDFTAE